MKCYVDLVYSTALEVDGWLAAGESLAASAIAWTDDSGGIE
jgi:hypothetical protein